MLLSGCDDDGVVAPDAEPEPEPPPTAPMLLEARALDGRGDAVHRDVYAYVNGRIDSVDRLAPDGSTRSVFVFERGADGQLAAVTVYDGPETLFRDEYHYADGVLDGVDRFNAEGGTEAVQVFDFDTEGLRSIEGVDGPDRLYLDQISLRGGHPASIVRTGADGALIAAFGVTSGAEGDITRLDVSMSSGGSLAVEYTYDASQRVEPPALETLLVYPLTARDGRPLPPLGPAR